MKIYYKVLKATMTPEALAQLSTKKIILESANQTQVKGRYSIVALDYYGTITLYDDFLEIKTQQQSETITTHFYDYFKNYINQFNESISHFDLQDLPFISGFIGSCSFDLARHEFPILKKTPLKLNNEHDARFFMIEDVYVFDHYKDDLYVIATNQFSLASQEQLEARVENNIKRLYNIQPLHQTIDFQHHKVITSNIDKTSFLNMISQYKQKIQSGDMFQVVPSRIYSYQHHFGNQLHQLTFQLYQNLKRQNPSPYMYYINMDEPIIIGSSPESFVKVHKDKVYTNPIAGTIQRGTTPDEDLAHAQQLLNDSKERSEHSMLVDLGRNDINRIALPGSTSILKLMEIEKYEHVMHIVSEVRGNVDKSLSPMTIIASLLPTGTVSGAPKLRAIQRIYESHPYKRGIYSGGIGYINCNQDLDFALAIRTMLIDDKEVHVEAGCGVVYDSIPEKELRETQLKAKSLLEVTP
ncbi:anthranilate synthase component I [Staphylococcus sp. HMSC061C10]|uniref:anthranilate synthase component I n=1 Tax=Staphylococcus sp. HMSC061C10 TaxID=1715056 RepID=UPI0008A9A9AF|nr:anthranilate synthase component I [Staphylococcus sp. HMSC061C10]OHP54410.1 anthranilate synthase [Staphylococcus sp. HMSC061C10]